MHLLKQLETKKPMEKRNNVGVLKINNNLFTGSGQRFSAGWEDMAKGILKCKS